MTVFGVVVVVGAIKVGGHDGNIVGAILPVEEFAVFQSADFSQGVGFVGLFQLTREQARFLHGLWRHARVDARRAEEFELLAAVLPCRMDDVHFEDHVVVHEIGQGRLVGDDAAYFSRRKENIIWLLCLEEGFHLILTAEVEFFMGSSDDIGVALAL